MPTNLGCIELGTFDNPCRVKVLGPTLGLVAGAAGAIFYWPVGGVVYCMNHVRGRMLMSKPKYLYKSTKNTIPI
jgi:hypothetical protein